MYRFLLALSFVAVASQAQTGAAGATGDAGTIDPGMSKAQVIEKLGKPATVRTYQGSTYLMYPNKCGKTCGMQDIVILDHDVVVDAVFRSPNRHYTGTSSSPEATKANSRTQRNASLAVPAAEPAAVPTAALKVAPSPPPAPPAPTVSPADSTKTLTTHAPADSAKSSTSRPPADSVSTPTSRPPVDATAPTAASTQAPYGKAPTAAPPADSAASAMSHPPVDNSASSTAHPPKPPK
jgi:hypothetical protein